MINSNKFWIISDNSNYIFNLTGSGSVSVSRSYIVYSLAGKDVIHNMSANVTATTGKFYTVSASGSTTINLVGANKFIRHVCSNFFKLSTDLIRSSARLALHAWWGGTHREIWGYVELIQKGFLKYNAIRAGSACSNVY